jgi:RNA polymerase sigma factor (sigma-70 family)
MLAKAKAAVLRVGAQPQDADDILQEAFARLEAYTQTHELRSEDAFLITTAVNISRDHARRRQRWESQSGGFDFQHMIDEDPDAYDVLHAKERLRRAKAGLAQLKPQVRRCLLAQRLEGLTYAEIGQREAITPAAAQKSVARAMIFLTKWMDGW